MLPMYRPKNSRQAQVRHYRPKHLHRDMRRSCVNQLQLSLNKGLRFDSRSRIGAGRLRSNFEPEFKLWSARIQTGMPQRIVNSPPGAVGAWYGSGCFHFSSRSSASWNKAWKSRISWGLDAPSAQDDLLSAVADLWCSCLPQIMTWCTWLVPSIDIDERTSREPISRNVDRANWETLVRGSSLIWKDWVTYETACLVDIVAVQRPRLAKLFALLQHSTNCFAHETALRIRLRPWSTRLLCWRSCVVVDVSWDVGLKLR